MAEYRSRQKLSDADVGEILTSADSVAQLALRFQIAEKNIRAYRNRLSKRALRIARELGLPPINAKPPLIPDEDSDRAYVVRGLRG